MLNKIKKKYFIDKLTQKIDVKRYFLYYINLFLLMFLNFFLTTLKSPDFR
jgi:hypothetical protein